MHPSPNDDVIPYYIIRMTQIRYLFLCSLLPCDPDQVIVGKHEVRQLDARGGHKSINVFGLLNYFHHRLVVSLLNLPT